MTVANVEVLDLQDKLYELESKKLWNDDHLTRIIAYNRVSFTFWLLVVISICFSALNFIYGFQGSSLTGFWHALIGSILFSSVEFAIPIASYMASWNGTNKFTIRSIGYVILLPAILFSVLILQGSYSKNSTILNAKSEQVKQLSGVKSNSLTKYVIEKEQLLLTKPRPIATVSASIIQIKQQNTCGSKSNRKCWTSTKHCEDATSDSSISFCQHYASLIGELGNAKALASVNQKIEQFVAAIEDQNVGAIAGNENEVISMITGYNTKDIEATKPTILVMIVSLVTHLLWIGHGKLANNHDVELDREERELSNLRRQISRKELEISNNIVTPLSIVDKPAIRQVIDNLSSIDDDIVEPTNNISSFEKFVNNDDGLSFNSITSFLQKECKEGVNEHCQLSYLHDHYEIWCDNISVVAVDIKSFSNSLSDIGYTQDGNRVIGFTI